MVNNTPHHPRTKGALALLARVAFHTCMISAVAALLAIFTMDLATLQLYYQSVGDAFHPNWFRIGLHGALSATLWGCVTLLYTAFQSRRSAQPVRLAHPGVLARGAVMVETLIILAPFLLLTSGLAQFSLNNSAYLLADLAAYQGARAAWLWQPEADAGRKGANAETVKFRAMTAIALVLAPTAPTDFYVGRNFPGGSGPPFRRVRTAIAASFRPGVGLTGQQEWSVSGSNWAYFGLENRQASARNTTYSGAFDSVSFSLRAGRKCTQAWMGIENSDFQILNSGGEVGVQFTYKHNQVFPWFAYIFGGSETVAGRTGNYQEIKRSFTLPAQPSMQ